MRRIVAVVVILAALFHIAAGMVSAGQGVLKAAQDRTEKAIQDAE